MAKSSDPKKTRRYFEVSPDFETKFPPSDFPASCPIYQTSNGVSIDVDKALLDDDGLPITVGYSETKITKDTFIFNKNVPLTFNKKFPDRRMQAFEARANLAKLASSPTSYQSKFDAVKFANNSATALLNSINSSDNE